MHLQCNPNGPALETLLSSDVGEEISSVLCDHLEGWDRKGGRETQEGGDMGIYICVSLIHFVIQ